MFRHWFLGIYIHARNSCRRLEKPDVQELPLECALGMFIDFFVVLHVLYVRFKRWQEQRLRRRTRQVECTGFNYLIHLLRILFICEAQHVAVKEFRPDWQIRVKSVFPGRKRYANRFPSFFF